MATQSSGSRTYITGFSLHYADDSQVMHTVSDVEGLEQEVKYKLAQGLMVPIDFTVMFSNKECRAYLGQLILRNKEGLYKYVGAKNLYHFPDKTTVDALVKFLNRQFDSGVIAASTLPQCVPKKTAPTIAVGRVDPAMAATLPESKSKVITFGDRTEDDFYQKAFEICGSCFQNIFKWICLEEFAEYLKSQEEIVAFFENNTFDMASAKLGLTSEQYNRLIKTIYPVVAALSGVSSK